MFFIIKWTKYLDQLWYVSLFVSSHREFSLQIYYVISSISFQIKRDLYRQEVCMMWSCCNNKKYLCEWRTLCSHPAGSVLLHYKVKYKEDMKEMSFNLYSLLPDTLDTQHAKELTEMQSEVSAGNIQSVVRSHRITRRRCTELLLIVIFIEIELNVRLWWYLLWWYLRFPFVEFKICFTHIAFNFFLAYKSLHTLFYEKAVTKANTTFIFVISSWIQ